MTLENKIKIARQKEKIEIVIPWAFPAEVRLQVKLNDYKHELYNDANAHKMPVPPALSGYAEGTHIKGFGNKILDDMVCQREDKRVFFYIEHAEIN